LAYSLETGQSRGRRFFGYIQGIALNPQGDKLAVTTDESLISLLDVETLNPMLTQRLEAGPERVGFTPDGLSLLVTTATGHLVKLSVSSLATVADIFPTAKSRVIAVACSPDSTKIATSDRDGKIKIWSSDFALINLWKAHDRYARSLSFDPTGNYLVSGGEEAVLKVWRVPGFNLVKESKDYHQESIRSIAFSSDGRMITGGFDGLCQFWSSRDFEASQSFTDYRGYITACAVSPDGRWLVRGGSSLEVVPLDRPHDSTRIATYGGSIQALAVAPDRTRFVTGGLDKGLYHWRVNPNNPHDISAKASFLEDWITAIDYCRNSRSIAAGLVDGKVAILAESSLEREKSWAAHVGRIVGLAALGENLVTVGEDAYLRLWDLDGHRISQHVLDAPGRSLTLRDRRLAVGTSAGSVVIFDSATLTQVHSIKGRPVSITTLGFTRDGERLVVGYFDGGIELYETARWRLANFRASEGSSSSVLSIAVNPELDVLAVGRRDGSVDLLNPYSLAKTGGWEGEGLEALSIKWILDRDTLAVTGASNGVSLIRSRRGVSAGLGMNH
jgi:WD40 repeat protein